MGIMYSAGILRVGLFRVHHVPIEVKKDGGTHLNPRDVVEIALCIYWRSCRHLDHFSVITDSLGRIYIHERS